MKHLQKKKKLKMQREMILQKIKAVTRVKKEKEVEELRALKEKNVAKLTAEKELEVAKLAKESAEQEAMGMLVKKEAEAKANRLLVQAGLTPSEKAQIDKDIKIGLARELAKIALPKIVVSGGSGNGKSDPMDAVGLKMLLDNK